MGIKTVPHSPNRPELTPCDFWLFPKLTGCRYETIEEMKGAYTKVIDTLTQEDFHGAFQKLLEWYNKCIATGGDYFEGDWSFMCVLPIKVPIRKMSANLSYAPRIHNLIQAVTVCKVSLSLSLSASCHLLHVKLWLLIILGKYFLRNNDSF